MKMTTCIPIASPNVSNAVPITTGSFIIRGSYNKLELNHQTCQNDPLVTRTKVLPCELGDAIKCVESRNLCGRKVCISNVSSASIISKIREWRQNEAQRGDMTVIKQEKKKKAWLIISDMKNSHEIVSCAFNYQRAMAQPHQEISQRKLCCTRAANNSQQLKIINHPRTIKNSGIELILNEERHMYKSSIRVGTIIRYIKIIAILCCHGGRG